MIKKLFKKLEWLKHINLIHKLNIGGVERKLIVGFSVALFIVVNILIAAVALRLDLSYGKAYTLSDATRKILKEIDKPVTLTFYVSSNLPTRMIPYKSEVTDLINEYKKVGGTKIDLKIIDPKNSTKIQEQVRQLNIPELKFSQVERDKYAVTAAYFGIALTYNGANQVLPQVTNIENLEYDLTAAIYRLTRKDLPKVGVIGVAASQNGQDTIASLRQLMSQQFQIEEIDLSLGKDEKKKLEIDTSFKTVLLFDDNSTQYSKEQIAAIETYLKNKGKMIFFVDGVWVNEINNVSGVAAQHNLFEILKKHGIELEKNLVLSYSAELVNIGTSSVSFLSQYPFWIKTNVLNPEVSYFANISYLTFPWVSSIKTVKVKDTKISEIVKSTERSWVQTKDFTVNPQQQTPQPKMSELKQYAVSVQAVMNNGTTVLVIPSSRFVKDRFLSQNSKNLDLVLNIVNEMASGGALSGIRQRQLQFYQMPDLPESQKDIFKYGNMLLLPLLFVVYGIRKMMFSRNK